MEVKDFTVPKDQARVMIRAPQIEECEYLLFLAGGSSRHRGHQSLTEALNGPNRVVAAKAPDGAFLMVRTAKIIWVQVLDPSHTEDDWVQFREHATRVAGRLRFDDGSEIAGEIVELTRRSARRLKDLLNLEERFVHLEDRNGDLYLVNLDRLVAAWPEE